MDSSLVISPNHSFSLFQKCGSSSSRMDGFRRHYIKDHLRNTMMRQEELFRFQVLELHRLYRVQRTLMAEMGSSSSSSKALLHQQLDMNSTNSGTSNNFSDRWISLATSETYCDSWSALGRLRCGAASSEDQSLSLGKQMKEKKKKKSEAESDLQLTLSIACGTHENWEEIDRQISDHMHTLKDEL